jgi:hypothetical protein
VEQRLDSKQYCPQPSRRQRLGSALPLPIKEVQSECSPWMTILPYYRTVQYHAFLHARLMGESLTGYGYVFLRVPPDTSPPLSLAENVLFKHKSPIAQARQG